MDLKNDENLKYDKLLDRIYMGLPDNTLDNTRFEPLKVDSIIQGKQTIWKNFTKMAKDIKRDPNHLYRFVLKEISTASTLKSGTLTLNGTFYNSKLNAIFEKYLNNFVLCSACKKPDTEFTTQNGVKVLKCSACGAVTSISQI